MATVKTEEVGAEIISLCTKCKTQTEHIVASKVGEKIGKVRCKACESTHRYLKAGSALPATTPRKPSKRLPPEEIWNRCVQNASTKKTAYTLSGAYKLNDLIDHSHFGLGVVTLMLSKDKIQATFKEGEKVLIMGMNHPL
jgi:hypothetical protein